MKNCRILIESKNLEEILGDDFFENIPKRYLKKNSICYPDTPRILILKEGKLKISLIENNKELILYYLHKNNFCFCNNDIMVTAREDSEFYFLESHNFTSIFKKNEFCNLLLNSINKNIIYERELLKLLAFKNSRERIAKFLYETALSIGEKVSQGILLELKCTMEESASFLGISRQSFSAIINEMIDKGVLEKKGYKRILIKNIEKLKNFCE